MSDVIVMFRGRLAGLLLVASAIGGCGPSTRDARDVAVRGPILVAAFPPMSQNQVEADEPSGRLLHDFQAYLDEVRSELASGGVALYEWYAPELRLASESGTAVYTIAPDTVQVMYYFVEPGRAPCILRGVRTAAELLRAAADCFDLDLTHPDRPR
ncbi:MAG: hypothetical protein E4H37_03550 [Gemmatimonadales bacterium]|jgi:hypothetical protein|nr:MAG: hypothetical protein E4H37_03550 [Gemmatimonadales bacterium]